MPQPYNDNSRHIYHVSELNQDVRTLLETGFPQLWLEGEISNFSCPSSGHWYFTLKDSRAQVRCAMFKNKNAKVGFTPKQGDKILAKVKISLYEARGEYQLIADSMEEAGFGALQRAYEVLKSKLQKEGLFDSSLKQTLPRSPKQIGVITSATGAAIRDVLSVLKRRYPMTPILLYPTLVQGNSAPTEIIKAITTANNQATCDVIILTRGGGSLEDLWAFNDESVARAIFHCRIPIISAIGHEVDFTIADFVADVRAATPSAAAEQVVPDQAEIHADIVKLKQRLLSHFTSLLSRKKEQLYWLQKQIKHPAQQLNEKAQRLDELELRLHQGIKNQLNYKQQLAKSTRKLLSQLSPDALLKKKQQNTQFLIHRLQQAMENQLNHKRSQFIISSRTLNTVSPLATLDRGYSIVSHQKTNHIIQSHNDIQINEEIKVKLNHGQLLCTVKQKGP